MIMSEWHGNRKTVGRLEVLLVEASRSGLGLGLCAQRRSQPSAPSKSALNAVQPR